MTTTLSVENLKVIYGDQHAVDGITFGVDEGTVLGILGSNGAGKSSTMKTIAGVIRPDSGTVSICGHPLTTYRGSNAARALLGYCPDVGGLMPQATLREHIDLSLSLHRSTHLWDAALTLVEEYGMAEALDKPTSSYSHGMSRRASCILAALSARRLLILDEPFDGVDPQGVRAVQQTIRQAAENGLAVVISTHLQNLLAQSTDEIMVMKKGHILTRHPSSHFAGDEGLSYYENLLAADSEENEPVSEDG